MSKTVQTVAASVVAKFGKFNPEAFIRGSIPFGNDEPVKPSHIKMNKGAAVSAMGGSMGPASFLTGLAFFTTAYACGQGKLEDLQKGLPRYAQFALVAACSSLKFGAGVTAEPLRLAVLSGLEKMLALPLTAPKEQKALTQSETAPETAPETEQGDKAPALSGLLEVARMESEHSRQWGAYGDALAQAFKDSQAVKANEAAFVAQFNSLADSDADKARALLEQMAEKLGLVVRKAPAKRTGTNG